MRERTKKDHDVPRLKEGVEVLVITGPGLQQESLDDAGLAGGLLRR